MIRTKRLVVREMSADDAPFILRLLNEPSFLRFIGDRGVRTLDDARGYLTKGAVEDYRRLGFGMYAVELQGAATPVGICGLLKREKLADVDLGLAFLPEYWERGYALEAATAVVTYAREVLGLNRLVAIVSSGNARSIGLLEKLGMEFERNVALSDDGPEIGMYSLSLIPREAK